MDQAVSTVQAVSTIQKIGLIGQFLSGISFLVTATIAIFTLFMVHKKQLDDAWLDRFRNLYQEFWNDKEMVHARHLINNKEGYDSLEVILKKRNEKQECDMTLQEYEILENIDNFCSVLARVRSFGLSIAMSTVQEELWGDLLFNFWIKKIKEKSELRTYVNNHWNKLLKEVKVKRRKKYIIF